MLAPVILKVDGSKEKSFCLYNYQTKLCGSEVSMNLSKVDECKHDVEVKCYFVMDSNLMPPLLLWLVLEEREQETK